MYINTLHKLLWCGQDVICWGADINGFTWFHIMTNCHKSLSMTMACLVKKERKKENAQSWAKYCNCFCAPKLLYYIWSGKNRKSAFRWRYYRKSARSDYILAWLRCALFGRQHESSAIEYSGIAENIRSLVRHRLARFRLFFSSNISRCRYYSHAGLQCGCLVSSRNAPA